MALQKEIRQDGGVVTSYHRILFFKPVINHHISIAVLSYMNEESRETEFDGARPYKTCTTYEKAYEENMTIEAAYDYLKTIPAFDGAQDV